MFAVRHLQKNPKERRRASPLTTAPFAVNTKVVLTRPSKAVFVARMRYPIYLGGQGVFGRKDYQQSAVIRYLVSDLAFPIDLVAAETLREADGLAMSSRNQYLSPAERPRAAEIHRVLHNPARDALQRGIARPDAEAQAVARLDAARFVTDYAVVRRPDLTIPAEGEAGPRVALIAARLGTTRLIDNLSFALS